MIHWSGHINDAILVSSWWHINTCAHCLSPFTGCLFVGVHSEPRREKVTTSHQDGGSLLRAQCSDQVTTHFTLQRYLLHIDRYMSSYSNTHNLAKPWIMSKYFRYSCSCRAWLQKKNIIFTVQFTCQIVLSLHSGLLCLLLLSIGIVYVTA